MVALSVFFVFQPHQGNRGISTPYGGFIGDQCDAAPDSDLIPAEYSCKKR
jgi:hypothetical protein